MRVRSIRSFHFVVVAATVIVAAPSAAQQPTGRVLTTADYDRAARFLGPNVNPLVIGGDVKAHWLPGDRFWYCNRRGAGYGFILVDPATRRRTAMADQAQLAAAIAAAGVTDTTSVRDCPVRASGPGRRLPTAVTSPDGKRAAFIRDYNLWVRDLVTGQEKQLTTDGVKDFGYATDNAGWIMSDRAVLLWSPDSKKIATAQQDERRVGEMYLVETKVGHPVLHSWKYPLPGDSVVAMLQRVIIEVDAGRVIRLQMPPDYHRATLGDDISMDDYAWSPDASKLALVSTSRDHKSAVLRVADAANGAVRTVFEETAPTHFESRAGWRVLWPSNEVIWYSQRDNWGQLYLYDLNTGRLKNQITTGEGPVSQISRVDEKTRTIWFTAYGREKGQDPYFRHEYRIGLDGKECVSLTPDQGDHTVQLSPSGRYLIDSYSTPDVPPVAAVRDRNGRQVMPLERADISPLLAMGWKPPLPITMKAHDGKTDIYGLMFRPTDFDSTKRYPIINNPYPGPQSGSTGPRTFAAARGDHQALAELGFIVVTIDGMGTPDRSKAFHDAYYGAMGRDNTIPDQVAGMKELARRYAWIDIDRAGIYGHSGGGFITADAMFREPDFFKVGISESGNHDQREYEDDWGERYQGLLTRNGNGPDSYEAEANQSLAKNLKGHLLLAHGTMDNNVPPYNTLLVVDALIRANKDFDLLLLPNQAHGYGVEANYMMRRRWDYFVRWLLNAEPPKEYEIKTPAVTRAAGG